MTIQTRRVFGKVCDVNKGRITFPNFFPVFCGNFVARIAGQLLRDDVSPSARAIASDVSAAEPAVAGSGPETADDASSASGSSVSLNEPLDQDLINVLFVAFLQQGVDPE